MAIPLLKLNNRGGELQTFLDEKLIPAIYRSLDTVFPEFGWSQSSRMWKATSWPSGFPLSVNHEEPGRLSVYEKSPFWLAVHGHSGMTLLAYANGGVKPTGSDFLETVERLSLKVGLKPPSRAFTPEQLEKARRTETRRNALEAVYDIAHENLLSDKGRDALTFLEGRGLNLEAVKELQFGLMPPVAELTQRLREIGGESLVKEAGEVIATWNSLEGYVSIPWRDEAGGALTIYGRWPSKDLPLMKDHNGFRKRREELLSRGGEEPSIPKTIGLPGEGTKASPLYFDRTKRAGHKDLVAVEGVLDAAVLQTRGDSRVVAYGGAQFTDEQVRTLVRQKIRSVVVVPDPDGGGEKGAVSSVTALEKTGIFSFVSSLPEGLDPDEFVLKYGLEEWSSLVDSEAITGAKYRAGLLLQDVKPEDSDIKRRSALEKVFQLAESFRGAHAPIDRQEVLELAGERTGYVGEALVEVLEIRIKDEERRRAQALLEQTTREATKAIKEGGDPFLIGLQMKEALSSLSISEEALPPVFSVTRLEQETQNLTEGLSTGWKKLDALDVHLHGGELTVLAARTGHGKTTALINLLDNLVDEEQEGVTLFFTMEEPEVRIYHRLLSLQTARENESPWTVNQVRDYLMGRDLHHLPDTRTLDSATESLRAKEGGLRVIYRPSWTVDKITAYVDQVARDRPIKAVLVDYLQRVSPGGNMEGRRRDEEVSFVARALRGMAVTVDCPVIVGAQINREAAKRGQEAIKEGSLWGSSEVVASLKKKRPQLHELREGGSEQEAELVLGLHNWRADFQDEEGANNEIPDATRLEVGVLKNRYGTVGKWAPLAFVGAHSFIRDPLDEREV